MVVAQYIVRLLGFGHFYHGRFSIVPKGHLGIAQRFNVGIRVKMFAQVPTGRLNDRSVLRQVSRANDFGRPFGTDATFLLISNVENVGLFPNVPAGQIRARRAKN